MSDVFLNILKDSKDPHYRYKMPKLTAKVEGSGNGIKTVITNMSTIAKAIGRPPSYPTKYFGCELGAQVGFNNDQYLVNGSHDPERLLQLLYSFIGKFVLCMKCNNPETNLTVQNQTIRQKCIACGHEAVIPKQLHKLTTFIINHPPDGNGGSGTAAAGSKSASSSSKSDKKSDKKSKKNGASGGHSPTNGHGDSGNDHNIDQVKYQEDADDFDDEELTAAAYSERMRELCDGFSSGMYLSDSKGSANAFYELVKEKKQANQLLDAEVQKELYKEAERLNIRDKATLILSELLFNENMIAQIKQYRMLLLRFCHQNRKAQKYLLGGFEKIVGDVYKDQLFNNTMMILKQFYDEDVLEEEAIIEWSLKESKKYVSKEMSHKIHEKAAPFIKWLKEAEEEEDSDEEENGKSPSPQPPQAQKPITQQVKLANKLKKDSEEDDEDEDDGIDLEFSHRVSGIQLEPIKPTVNVKVAVNSQVNGGNNEEEDFDIDGI